MLNRGAMTCHWNSPGHADALPLIPGVPADGLVGSGTAVGPAGKVRDRTPVDGVRDRVQGLCDGSRSSVAGLAIGEELRLAPVVDLDRHLVVTMAFGRRKLRHCNQLPLRGKVDSLGRLGDISP